MEEPDFGKIYEDMRTLAFKKVDTNKVDVSNKVTFESKGLVNYEEYSKPDPIDENSPNFYKSKKIMSIDEFCERNRINRSSPEYYEGKTYTWEEIDTIYNDLVDKNTIDDKPILKIEDTNSCPEMQELLNIVDKNLPCNATLVKIAKSVTKKFKKNYPQNPSLVVFKGNALRVRNMVTPVTRDHVETIFNTLSKMCDVKQAFKTTCAVIYKYLEAEFFKETQK